jgi:DNA-binding CsgD family transcriptional regulator
MLMSSLTDADLRAALDVAAVAGACQTMDDVRHGLLAATAGAVQADLVLYIQTSVVAPLEAVIAWPELTVDLSVLGNYWHVMQDHPLRILAANGMPDSVRLSEVVSSQRWHQNPVYVESHRAWGMEDQMVTLLGLRGMCLHLVSVSRAGRPFTDRERELLDEMRPHVKTAIRRAIATAQPYQVVRIVAVPEVASVIGLAVPEPAQILTPHEAVITGLVSTGLTTGQVARRLGVSPRTVDKHLEHVHAKLGVTNRVALVGAFRDLLQASI